MSDFSGGNVPGFQAKQDSQPAQVTWTGRHGQDLTATRKVLIDASATDPGNAPHTTTLRSGLVMAIKASDGKAYPFDGTANDGRQIAVGILEQPQEMLENGVATDRFTQILVQGLVRENRLNGLNTRAKSQLAGRFVFDGDLNGSSPMLMQPRGVSRVNGNTTLTKADHGKLIVAVSAAEFTLPTKEDGLAFRLLQMNDTLLRIIGSSDIVFQGATTASVVEFDTSSERKGSHVLIECAYVGENLLRWVVSNLGGTTATVS